MPQSTTDAPRHHLTVTLEPTADGGTLVGCHQEFEDPEVGRGMERIVVPANEALLERLSAQVLRDAGARRRRPASPHGNAGRSSLIAQR